MSDIGTEPDTEFQRRLIDAAKAWLLAFDDTEPSDWAGMVGSARVLIIFLLDGLSS